MTQSALFPYFMWFCAVLFYMYQFVIRVSPGVMVHDIMRDFQMDAHGFGTLSALALYTYSLLQIPMGIMADLWGARRIILISCLVCIAGTIGFALSQQLWTAQLGRIFIGAGSACAFLCVSKIAREWFSDEKNAMLFAMSMTAGTIGALNGGAPLSILMDYVGWRQTLIIVSIFGALIFLVNFIFLKNSPRKEKHHHLSKKEILKQITIIFKTPQCWINGSVALGIYMSVSVLADLWGVKFIQVTQNVERQVAAQAVSLIYVGLCLGSLLIAKISEITGKKKSIIVSCTFMIAVGLACVIFLPLSFRMVCIIFFLIGFFGGAEMICFAGACQATPSRVAATTTGFINFCVMFTGAIIQQQVGRILDYMWDGALDAENIRIYSAHHFRTALSLVVGVLVISTFVSFFVKKDNVPVKN